MHFPGESLGHTAGVDVKHPLRIAALDASIGRRATLEADAQSAGNRAAKNEKRP
jgi:hypothetical protein